MTLLTTSHQADLRDLLPSGRDRLAWHAGLTEALRQHLSPAHAAILARPTPTLTGLAWHADGTRAVPLPALAPAERGALLAAVGSILSDIRRLAESGRAPIVAACWPGLQEIPDLGHLFAVDGRPVLAGWGMIPAEAVVPPGLLIPHDDGLGWAVPSPVRRHHAIAWRALAALATLGLAIGIAAAAAQRLFPAQVCMLGRSQRSLLATAEQATEQHAALAGRLRGLRAAIATAQKRCVATAAGPLLTPAALPDQQWRQKDIGMLQGCWHRYTHMATHNVSTGEISLVKDWTLCFDRHGTGEQTLIWDDGIKCSNPITAHFNADGTLTIRDVTECGRHPPSSRILFLGRLICTRLSDTEASCPRTELNGPDPGHTAPGMFRR